MSRAVILEYDQPEEIFVGEERDRVFHALSESKKNASAVVGLLINFAYKLYCVDDLQSAVGQSIPGEVKNVFSDLLPRLYDTYSLWLYTVVKVK